MDWLCFAIRQNEEGSILVSDFVQTRKLRDLSLAQTTLVAKGRPQTSQRAFTLIELLIVLAVIVALAAMLLPALAKAKQGALVNTCLEGNKQLALAWAMYAKDNSEHLAINSEHSDLYNGSASWVGNTMTWDLSEQNTNCQYLVGSANSLLGPYLGNQYQVFVCPAAPFVSREQAAAGWMSRNRSVSMNAAIGDGAKSRTYPFSGSFWWAKKINDFGNPGPANSWLFADEHPDSIDDGMLYSYSGYTNGTGEFTGFFGNQHGGKCGICFVDGHAEAHKWLTSTCLQPVTYKHAGSVPADQNADLKWAAAHTAQP